MTSFRRLLIKTAILLVSTGLPLIATLTLQVAHSDYRMDHHVCVVDDGIPNNECQYSSKEEARDDGGEFYCDNFNEPGECVTEGAAYGDVCYLRPNVSCGLKRKVSNDEPIPAGGGFMVVCNGGPDICSPDPDF